MGLYFALGVACGPGMPLDSGSPVVDSDTVAPASQLWASRVQVAGSFGYDPALDQAVAYYFGDTSTPLQPWLELKITLEADGQLPSTCRVTLTIQGESTPQADWAQDPIRFGLDWRWDQVSVDDACPTLDPERYAEPLSELARHWDFGLGVLPLTAQALAEVEAAVVAAEGQAEWNDYWVDNVVGGAVAWDALGEIWTGGWALGFEVDEDMSLVSRLPGVAGPPAPPHDPGLIVPLSREAIEGADGLPRGVYSVNSLTEFDGDTLTQTTR